MVFTIAWVLFGDTLLLSVVSANLAYPLTDWGLIWPTLLEMEEFETPRFLNPKTPIFLKAFWERDLFPRSSLLTEDLSSSARRWGTLDEAFLGRFLLPLSVRESPRCERFFAFLTDLFSPFCYSKSERVYDTFYFALFLDADRLSLDERRLILCGFCGFRSLVGIRSSPSF